ncbi:MAG TPA: PIG-L family deacetylase [Polyangiaceae bacterium]
MKLGRESARVVALCEMPLESAWARTTHLGIGAHADDLEIMAAHGILECLNRSDRWFSGVVVADGAGGPRAPAYAELGEREMAAVRAREQLKAAGLGQYSALAMLGYPSNLIKRAGHVAVVDDLRSILLAARPELVYTHNLADKHDTHVAVALRVLEACRSLPEEQRPLRVLGCEVWRDLDWLCDADKVRLRVDGHGDFLSDLLGAHESQLATGKRYDLGTLGRQRAHATFAESHVSDDATALSWAMDLTPLIAEGAPSELAGELVERLRRDVLARIARLS